MAEYCIHHNNLGRVQMHVLCAYKHMQRAFGLKTKCTCSMVIRPNAHTTILNGPEIFEERFPEMVLKIIPEMDLKMTSKIIPEISGKHLSVIFYRLK